MPRKVILYIAVSVDGFIAQEGDSLDFLSVVDKVGEDYGYKNFISSVDTVIIGRKTFDWIMKHVEEFPHADKETYVITHQKISNRDKITFYNGNLDDLVEKLRNTSGGNIYCDGGAEIVNELLRLRSIDEIILSIIPVLVGKGTRLFDQFREKQSLELLSNKVFDSGLVQLHYVCRK